MQGKVTALLIFHQTKPYNLVEAALHKLDISSRRAKTLVEARRVLSRVSPPLLTFTERELPDGNWADVLSLSAKATAPVSVIVVGQEVTTKLYASAIEVGAFDFIAPPFEDMDLGHVVRCAADNAKARRQVVMSSRIGAKRENQLRV